MSTKITTKTGKPLTSAQHIFDSLESAIHSWKKSWIVKNGWDHVMSLPSFWAVAWFWQGLILTGETVQVLSQDHATFPKKMMFSLFSLDLKTKTWLGDDFNQFFIEIWYSTIYLAILFAATLWACKMSVNAEWRLDQFFYCSENNWPVYTPTLIWRVLWSEAYT